MQFHTIGIKDLEGYMNEPNTWLIDVRSKEEYDLYHIEGARNIPLKELEQHKYFLPKDKRFILYCERGSTSLMAAKNLSRSGYHVYTVIGGINAWLEQKLK